MNINKTPENATTFHSIQETLEIKAKEIRAHAGELTREVRHEDIIREVETFIGEGAIRNFFTQHPTRWTELCGILKSGIAYGGRTGQDISFDQGVYENDVYALFLIRDRESDMGNRIKDSIDTEIFHNIPLLRYAEKRNSILDVPAHHLSVYSEGNMKSLISQGLIESIEGCKYENVDTYIKTVLPKMTQYLPEVFGQEKTTYFDFSDKRNLQELTKTILSNIKNENYTKYGARRRDIMRIIKSFHAWGNIDAIEEAHEIAKEYAHPDNITALLRRVGIKLTDYHNIPGNIVMYKGKIQINGKEFEFYWRAKSMKSILQKLWQTAEYGNYEALRDFLGMSVVVSDDTDDETIANITRTFSKIMPNYGYIVKNRNMIPAERLNIELRKNRVKRPISPAGRSGHTTSAHLQNIALSGFSKIKDQEHACGTEVQIIRQSGFDWKKKEDPYYKVKGIIELMTRGEFFITHNQLKISLDKRISRDDLEKINEALQMIHENESFTPFQDMDHLIQYIVHQGIVIPYRYQNALVYVMPQHKEAFQRMIKAETWTPQTSKK